MALLLKGGGECGTVNKMGGDGAIPRVGTTL